MSTENEITEERVRSIVQDELNRDVEDIHEYIPYTRREVLRGIAILGTTAAVSGIGVYGAVGRAAADDHNQGEGTIGTSENPLEAIYVDELFQNGDHISALSLNPQSGSTVDIGGGLIPDQDAAYSLGSPSKRFDEVHSKSLATEVLTSGNYTIEHDDAADTLNFVYDSGE